MQHCQNVPAGGNFTTFSPFLAAHSTLDFSGSPLAGKETWHLLPATPNMLPAVTKRFERVEHGQQPIYTPYSRLLDCGERHQEFICKQEQGQKRGKWVPDCSPFFLDIF